MTEQDFSVADGRRYDCLNAMVKEHPGRRSAADAWTLQPRNWTPVDRRHREIFFGSVGGE